MGREATRAACKTRVYAAGGAHGTWPTLAPMEHLMAGSSLPELGSLLLADWNFLAWSTLQGLSLVVAKKRRMSANMSTMAPFILGWIFSSSAGG